MSDVQINIAADSTQLKSGLNASHAAVDQFAQKTGALSNIGPKVGASFTSMGATVQRAMGGLLAAVAALGAVKGLADFAGQISDLSRRFGTSAESMQRMKIVSDASGTSLETVAKTMNKMELAAVAAAGGNTEMDSAFQSLGMSAEEFMGMSIEERLIAMADGYDKSSNKAEALAAMVKLGGKSAGEMIPMLAQGGAAIKEVMGSATVASTNAIEKMDEVSDRVGTAFTTIKAIGISCLGAIMDVIDGYSVEIAAMMAMITAIPKGIGAAKKAYSDTKQAGIEYFANKKVDREERNSKASAANIEELRSKAKEEAKVEADAKAGVSGENENDAARKRMKAATDEKTLTDNIRKMSKEDRKAFMDAGGSDVAKEKRQKAMEAVTKEEDDSKNKGYIDTLANAKKVAHEKRQKEIEGAKGKEDGAKSHLDKLKNQQSANQIDSDQLRRIGGGFAKSNYAGLGKQQTEAQKQISIAEESLKELKKQTEALKPSNTTSGVES